LGHMESEWGLVALPADVVDADLIVELQAVGVAIDLPAQPGEAGRELRGVRAGISPADQEQKSWASRVRTPVVALVPERLTHSVSAWAPSPSGP